MQPEEEKNLPPHLDPEFRRLFLPLIDEAARMYRRELRRYRNVEMNTEDAQGELWSGVTSLARHFRNGTKFQDGEDWAYQIACIIYNRWRRKKQKEMPADALILEAGIPLVDRERQALQMEFNEEARKAIDNVCAKMRQSDPQGVEIALMRVENPDLSQGEIAKRCGVSQSKVSRKLTQYDYLFQDELKRIRDEDLT